jgi:hypothetical protein
MPLPRSMRRSFMQNIINLSPLAAICLYSLVFGWERGRLRAMCSIKSHRSIMQARSRWPWRGCCGGLALCYPSLTRVRSNISRKTLRQVRCSSLARNTNCSLRFQSGRIAVGFRDGPSNFVTGDA